MSNTSNKKPSKLFIIIMTLAAIIFIWDTINRMSANHKKNLNYDFRGIVSSVKYDIKNVPEIIIQGKQYFLSDGYYFEHKIEKGDSLIKVKNSTKYKLIKHNNGNVIIFDNQN